MDDAEALHDLRHGSWEDKRVVLKELRKKWSNAEYPQDVPAFVGAISDVLTAYLKLTPRQAQREAPNLGTDIVDYLRFLSYKPRPELAPLFPKIWAVVKRKSCTNTPSAITALSNILLSSMDDRTYTRFATRLLKLAHVDEVPVKVDPIPSIALLVLEDAIARQPGHPAFLAALPVFMFYLEGDRSVQRAPAAKLIQHLARANPDCLDRVRGQLVWHVRNMWRYDPVATFNNHYGDYDYDPEFATMVRLAGALGAMLYSDPAPHLTIQTVLGRFSYLSGVGEGRSYNDHRNAANDLLGAFLDGLAAGTSSHLTVDCARVIMSSIRSMHALIDERFADDNATRGKMIHKLNAAAGTLYVNMGGTTSAARFGQRQTNAPVALARVATR